MKKDVFLKPALAALRNVKLLDLDDGNHISVLLTGKTVW